MKGRKRHLAVDTRGLLLAVVVVTTAAWQDDAWPAFGRLLGRLCWRRPRRLRTIFADGMYEGSACLWAWALGWPMRIVKRGDGRAPTPGGFAPLPKRWVVERTFAWLGRYRRLSKDYEYLPRNSETMIYLAMINLMVHRLEPG